MADSTKGQENNKVQWRPVDKIVIEILQERGATLAPVADTLASLYSRNGIVPPEAIPALCEAFAKFADSGTHAVNEALLTLKEQEREHERNAQ